MLICTMHYIKNVCTVNNVTIDATYDKGKAKRFDIGHSLCFSDNDRVDQVSVSAVNNAPTARPVENQKSC